MKVSINKNGLATCPHCGKPGKYMAGGQTCNDSEWVWENNVLIAVPSRKPGAPIGNTNAAKEETRQRLNVRVAPATLNRLQRRADIEAGGNIGRWLDDLASRYD